MRAHAVNGKQASPLGTSRDRFRPEREASAGVTDGAASSAMEREQLRGGDPLAPRREFYSRSTPAVSCGSPRAREASPSKPIGEASGPAGQTPRIPQEQREQDCRIHRRKEQSTGRACAARPRPYLCKPASGRLSEWRAPKTSCLCREARSRLRAARLPPLPTCPVRTRRISASSPYVVNHDLVLGVSRSFACARSRRVAWR
jgi:hypothetical protein